MVAEPDLGSGAEICVWVRISLSAQKYCEIKSRDGGIGRLISAVYNSNIIDY